MLISNHTGIRRFHILDAMRGVAAIAVVLGHMPSAWCGVLKPSYFFLAVDLFFVISGFVIAFAYEQRLKNGMTVRAMMLARYVRLYPLYFAGTVLGILTSLAALVGGKGDLSPTSFVIATITSLFLFPSTWNRYSDLMPLNTPAWSLIYELMLNLFYATVLIRLKTLWLFVIVLLSGLLLVAIVTRIHTLHTGMTWATVPFGAVRAVFSYTLGASLYRVVGVNQRSSALGYAIPFFIIPALIGIASTPERSILGAVFLIFPLTVVLAIKTDVSFATPIRFLGDASYAIYILSVPIVTTISRSIHLLHIGEDNMAPWFAVMVIASLFFVAWFADKYDNITRRSIASYAATRFQGSKS